MDKSCKSPYRLGGRQMKKLKLVGVSSEDYPEGRIDSYRIKLPEKSPHHSHIIPLFLELGFPKDVVNENLDIICNEISYLFLYGNKRIKAHLSTEDNELTIRFDTSISRQKINKITEKYFEVTN